MSKLGLKRYCYRDDRTLGELYIGDKVFYTLERPWIPSPDHKGGLNFKSCIPDGEYALQPYSSEAHPDVWRLTNPNLDVFGNRPASTPGRWDILIHIGNYVDDVVGCVAVGMSTDYKNVWSSTKAINRLRDLLTENWYEINISPKGARNGE